MFNNTVFGLSLPHTGNQTIILYDQLFVWIYSTNIH